MENFEFTEKEHMIIRDVKKQNFYSRAMPLSLGCILGCHVLMRRGIVSTTRPFIRYIVFGSIGYTCGLISLPSQLTERLLNEAPDGEFAKFMKQTEKMSKEERKEFLMKSRQNAYALKTHGVSNTASPSEPIPQESTVPNQGNQNVFPQQTPTAVLDIVRHPESGKSTSAPEPGFSYRQQRNQRNLPESQPSVSPVVEVTPTSQDTNRRVRRNKYGDEMD